MTTYWIGRFIEEAFGLGQHLEVEVEHLSTASKLLVSLTEAFCQVLALQHHAAKARLKLRDRQFSIRYEVD